MRIMLIENLLYYNCNKGPIYNNSSIVSAQWGVGFSIWRSRESKEKNKFNFIVKELNDIGKIESIERGLISMFALGAMGLVVIIPGVVPHFFLGATSAVFGNSTGGRRGAIIGSFVNGIIISFLPVALLPVLGKIGVANTTFS